MDGKVRGSFLVLLMLCFTCFTANAATTYLNGTKEIDGNQTYNDYVEIDPGANITFNGEVTITNNKELAINSASALFKKDVTIDDELYIHGDSRTTFKGALVVTGEMGIHEGKSINVFEGIVKAELLVMDQIPGEGGSNNTFHRAVTLDGYGGTETLGGKQYGLDLAIMDGTTVFNGAVTLNRAANTAAIFMDSTTTFKDILKVGQNGDGTVSIGYWTDVVDWMKESGNPTDTNKFKNDPNFYNNTATVILEGNNAKIIADQVNVISNGVLDVAGNASITGNVNFAAGSTFAIDAKHQLVVNGTTTIDAKATANVQGIDTLNAIGRTILSSTSITGQFDTHEKSLYTVKTDGNVIKISGMNKVEDVLKNNNIVTGNSATSAAMTTLVLNDSTASKELRESLSNVIQDITTLAASNHELAEVATMQLFGENVLSAATATQTTAESFSSGINNHQIQLRDQANAGGNSTNSNYGYASINPRYYRYNDTANRIWAAGFGAWTKQRDKDRQAGYKYNAGGFILGYDREYGDFVFGVSGAYSNGDIKNNEGYTKTDVDTFNVGLYGSYNPACGLFVDANIGIGWAWNDVKTNNVLGGTKKGKFRNTSFQMGGNIGYTFNFGDNFRFIPTVGLQYTHVRQQDWREHVSNPGMVANRYGKVNNNYVSIPLAVRVNKTFELGNCVSITPEIRAAYIYEAKKNQPTVRMGYVGSSAMTTLRGIDSGRSRGLIGAGVKAKITRNVDVFADYNFEFRKKYTNHNVMAGVGLSF